MEGFENKMTVTQSETQLSKRKKIIRNSAVVFLGIILLLTFFSSTINNFLLPMVEYDSPDSGALIHEITAEGEVFPRKLETVYAYGSWKIKDLMVKEGDAVKAGDILATVDSKDLELEIKKKELELLKLRNELASYKSQSRDIDLEQYGEEVELALKAVQKAEKNLNDQKELFAADAIPLETVNEAQDRLDTAQRDYEQKQKLAEQKEKESTSGDQVYLNSVGEKEADIEVCRLELENMKKNYPGNGAVKAAFDGTVESVNTSSGASVNNGQVLIELVKKDTGLAVKWSLDSKSASQAALNDPVDFTGESAETLELSGIVNEKKYIASEGQFEYVSYIDEAENKPQVGQKFNVTLRKSSEQYRTLLPAASVIDEGGKDYVFLLKTRDGILGKEYYVDKIEVKVLEKDDLHCAISGESIQSDEKIVIFATKVLSDNDQVKLR